ncbi:MAG: nitroreductase family deazaflavin-dependent oxidoreductase [Chloroflexota bacterium]
MAPTSNEIRANLLRGGVVDITTTGRKTGKPRRIEIRLHVVDGQLYLTAAPGKRSWYANLLANPDFKVHLKNTVIADLAAYARPVLDEDERQRTFSPLLELFGKPEELETRMRDSPLVHVSVEIPA